MDKQDFYQKVRQLRLTSSRVVDGLYSGNYRSVFKGPGLEFDEVREYDVADDARFIDWNVASRLGTPFTKTFREERELVLQIIADISPTMDTGSGVFSKRDVMNITFANLTFAAVSRDDKVGAVFFSLGIDGWIAPKKGKTQALSLIQDCLSLKAGGSGSDLALALRTAHEALKRRGILVVISDFKTSGYWKELAILAKKHDVICVRITDPQDEEFPEGGLVELQDPETGHVVLGLGRSRRFLQEYHDFWTLQRLHWRKECRRRGVHIVEISTDEDPAAKLLAFFNRRRRR